MPHPDTIRFRSSPHVELKQLGDLPAGQRERFRELENEPDFFGLLVAQPPLTINVQSVSRQTAELLRALATPSPLDAESAAAAVDLVLDGILEIDGGGGFVSGADALPLLSLPPPLAEAGDAVSRLSRDALLHG